MAKRGQRKKPDRRNRLGRSAAQASSAKRSSNDYSYSVIGPDWIYIAPAICIGLFISVFVSGVYPNFPAIFVAVLSVAIVSASRWLLGLEKAYAKTVTWKVLLLLFAVATPMFLLGLSVQLWVLATLGQPVLIATGTLAIVAIIAVISLHGRLPSIFAALAAIACGFTMLSAPLVSLGMGVCAIVAEVILLDRQIKRIIFDISDRAATKRVQHRSDALLAEYEATGQGWFWETDRRGQISYVSPRIAKLLGSDSSGLVGRPFTTIFQLDDTEIETERTLKFHLSTRSSFQDLGLRAATDEKEERWWSITGRPVLDEFNNYLGFRGSGSDLTEARRSQRHVTQLARFDSLTKLANRFQMAEWLEKILESPQAENRRCAVFMLDLDRFKQVNDTMGHPTGDALLRQVADRLRTSVNGLGKVGRLGGDEFQVVLPGKNGPDALGDLAHRIIEDLSQPYSIDGVRVTIGASLGISVCPDHGKTSEELIRNADLALYAAKDGGRGRFHMFADDLHNNAKERRQIEQDLRDAILLGKLELHYQPQVSTTTERISGFEALLRWDHPQHGYLSPAKFVPIAEESGLVETIGEWALRTACDQLAQWPETVRVAVNVSPLQFSNPALPAIITSAIASAQINPDRLELEITESVFLNDDRSTESMFSALKAIGVRLALDDFGTGYSSLGYLKRAPFDKIKIDQSFVSGATVKGSRNGAIISSIVNLAESLGMETTAEGVETLDELELIRAHGCSHIQGYIYEKALTADKVTALLESGLTAIAHGPQSARSPRQTMLRKLVLENGGHCYNGTIRNISVSGAMVEGLWNVPAGTVFDLHLSPGHSVKATTRWSNEDRMGIEFAEPMKSDGKGGISLLARSPDAGQTGSRQLRKAG